MAIALQVRLHERRICEKTLEHVKKLWLGVMVDDKLWEEMMVGSQYEDV